MLFRVMHRICIIWLMSVVGGPIVMATDTSDYGPYLCSLMAPDRYRELEQALTSIDAAAVIPNLICDQMGNSMLHLAVLNKSFEQVSLLLDHRANPFKYNLERARPLSYAISGGVFEIIDTVMKAEYQWLSSLGLLFEAGSNTANSVVIKSPDLGPDVEPETEMDEPTTRKSARKKTVDKDRHNKVKKTKPQTGGVKKGSKKTKRKPYTLWTTTMDNQLMEAVAAQGDTSIIDWDAIVRDHFRPLTKKQVRERYTLHLNGINKGPFTDEEETQIIELYQEHGRQWSLIAAELNGEKTTGRRTDQRIKNFINSWERGNKD